MKNLSCLIAAIGLGLSYQAASANDAAGKITLNTLAVMKGATMNTTDWDYVDGKSSVYVTLTSTEDISLVPVKYHGIVNAKMKNAHLEQIDRDNVQDACHAVFHFNDWATGKMYKMDGRNVMCEEAQSNPGGE
ncbi:hypothetical protein C1X72_17845 [Pseudomonas sp. FW306-2-2C-D06B]|uniref:hypothetical protein n=1 Tax=unclassified Pseudomonas TaxID=196821 RepID=UPI000C87E716|nr:MULTISPECIES: hypothetical protein [unclassified Pseudomonas]PMY79864.1 hypothetical protein C1X72_17845 [Pseudomonas sp. FW306-2-2C-D06B]PNA98428.1 hypothetical protein C1X74_11660 [Pseudomonas sp. GW460-5]PNB58887.1 hypothetical protein C1X73_12750 [Pseudomonas sp. FW305-130]POA73645.1 hypothetical protein C1890_27140 [Pseudomonas sp. DP16D-R1]